jgi:hypothetical protein
MEIMDDSFPTWGTVYYILEIIYGKALMEQIEECLHQFKYQLKDSRCIPLLLIILLFSTSNNYTGQLNTLVLYKIQEKYTRLLWMYLKQRYGELLACQKLSLIIRYCLHLQIIYHIFELTKRDGQWHEYFMSIS